MNGERRGDDIRREAECLNSFQDCLHRPVTISRIFLKMMLKRPLSMGIKAGEEIGTKKELIQIAAQVPGKESPC